MFMREWTRVVRWYEVPCNSENQLINFGHQALSYLPSEIILFCAHEYLIFWCFITSFFWFKEYCRWLFLNRITVNDKTSDIVMEEGFDFHTPIFITFQTVLHYVHRQIYQLIFTVAWHFISPYNSSSLSHKHGHDLAKFSDLDFRYSTKYSQCKHISETCHELILWQLFTWTFKVSFDKIKMR
jgi:hypothetical protein